MNVSLGSWLRWSQSKKIQYLPLVEYKYQVVQNLSRTSSSHSGLKLQKSPSKAPVSLFFNEHYDHSKCEDLYKVSSFSDINDFLMLSTDVLLCRAEIRRPDIFCTVSDGQ